MSTDRFRVTELPATATGGARIHVIDLMLPETLDSQEFDRLNDALLSVFHGHTSERWLLDLSHVRYMGSAVLGLMVNIRQQIIKDQGRLVLCSLSQRLSEIFFATSLQRLFTISKNREDALKAVA